MKNSKLVSIVVPAMNEGENVNPFYSRVSKLFQDLEYEFEIIVIYDETDALH